MKTPPWLDGALARSESLSLDSEADRARLGSAVARSTRDEIYRAAYSAGIAPSLIRLLLKKLGLS